MARFVRQRIITHSSDDFQRASSLFDVQLGIFDRENHNPALQFTAKGACKETSVRFKSQQQRGGLEVCQIGGDDFFLSLLCYLNYGKVLNRFIKLSTFSTSLYLSLLINELIKAKASFSSDFEEKKLTHVELILNLAELSCFLLNAYSEIGLKSRALI